MRLLRKYPLPPILRAHRIHCEHKESAHVGESHERIDVSPLESCMVEAWASMPASIPLYRTSEWEMRAIGFLSGPAVCELNQPGSK